MKIQCFRRFQEVSRQLPIDLDLAHRLARSDLIFGVTRPVKNQSPVWIFTPSGPITWHDHNTKKRLQQHNPASTASIVLRLTGCRIEQLLRFRF